MRGAQSSTFCKNSPGFRFCFQSPLSLVRDFLLLPCFFCGLFFAMVAVLVVRRLER